MQTSSTTHLPDGFEWPRFACLLGLISSSHLQTADDDRASASVSARYAFAKDPKLYMIRWLAERCSEEQLKKGGLARTDPWMAEMGMGQNKPTRGPHTCLGSVLGTHF